ncbi:hypothetical protein HYH03_010808 [Edaphochlamys debaryana]|uniref:Uncharacterized protein n=1 Tax=Edaphochlamys debaryana TaxID=47281 RepID=A0A835XVG1_9CHLO|nr:hypothetical protein HYH03_010808 [Edaphochlamys debaryana]|eukprot:KAG2490891.1 hypothetical protein HYH03_010808 [Edaphochlamys debaryana]
MTAKPQSSSRLQKLLTLLETGTSEATRKAAAKQLAEIARAHPDQLLSTVQKVHGYLYHKNWETRVAAGEALSFLADIFEHHIPDDLARHALACGVEPAVLAQAVGEDTPLTFASFSLQQVLDKGTPLGASGGQEFDLVLDPSLPPKARLAAQREGLKKRLGMAQGVDLGIDPDALFGDEDLDAGPAPQSHGAGHGAAKQAAQELMRGMEADNKLSARERNRLKRKAKALGRSDSARSELPVHGGPAARHKSPLDQEGSQAGSAEEGEGGPGGVASGGGLDYGDEEVQHVSEGGWPFQRLADQLVVDSLDPVWEVRHGAALALRELLRAQAAAAGVEAPLDSVPTGWASAGGSGKRGLGLISPEHVAAARSANRRWLEDCCAHLLCVLALDRFGDYGSDQVTAPVRETAAQALGMALVALDPLSVARVASMLAELQVQPDWRVRYGGFCGLKYALAARLDMAPALLPAALPLLRRGLADPDDDVRAACADALVPVAGALGVVGAQAVSELRTQLWDLLPNLSDLSAATNSVMSLLAHLYGTAGMAASGGGGEDDGNELTELVPRLWPLVRHTLSTVRVSVMSCLERMLLPYTRQSTANGQAHHPSPQPPAGSAGVLGGDWTPAEQPPIWLQPLLPALLTLVFQNVILEGEPRVLDASLRVWRLAVRCAAPSALRETLSPELLRAWMTLASTQVGRPLDSHLVLWPHATDEGVALLPLAQVRLLVAASAPAPQPAAADFNAIRSPKRSRSSKAQAAAAAAAAAAAQSGPPAAAAPTGPVIPHDFVVGGPSHGDDGVARMRTLAAQCLGPLLSAAHAAGSGAAAPELYAGLTSPFATSRLFGALAAVAWLQHAKGQLVRMRAAENPHLDPAVLAEQLQQQQADQAAEPLLPLPLLAAVFQALAAAVPSAPLVPASAEPYGEVVPYYAQMRREVMALVAIAMESNVLLPLPPGLASEAVTPEHASALASAALAAGPAEGTPLALAVTRLHGALSSLQALEQYLHVTALASMAAAAVHSGRLPEKFNTVILPLMNSLRREPQMKLQEVCAGGLAELLSLCAARMPSPNEKLVRNLWAMATADLLPPLPSAPSASAAALGAGGPQGPGLGPGPPDGADGEGWAGAGGSLQSRISRRGGEVTLVAMAQRFGQVLWTQVPVLWALLATPLQGEQDVGGAVASLHVLRVLCPVLAPQLVPSVRPLLGEVARWARHADGRVRAAAARAASCATRCWTEGLMPELLKQVVPMLAPSAPDVSRLGGAELVGALCSDLGAALVPYAVLLLVPLLRTMSDPHPDVRAAAAGCFGALMTLLPLAQGVPTPPGLDGDQLATVQQDSAFLLQLLDNRNVQAYSLPFELPYKLRPYQQDGVSWLAFLRRFGLHGVLADDMGLGKTLQASCIMASASLEAEAAFAASGFAAGSGPLPLLVVCPATLVGHWAHEVTTTVGPEGLRPMQFGGEPGERAAAKAAWEKSLRSLGPKQPRLPYNMLVMSYESLRADVEWVASKRWLYAVLDEGHAIRNPRSRITLATKRIVANHRLLLSGTPIQNDVLEMWSLFDFLMPGFLGPERAFRAKFGKALQESRVSKKGSREAEAGLLALEGLHRSLLPFVLRRTKGQVLADLPPKIVTDIYCDLSEMQARLYADFQASKASSEAVEALRSGEARRTAAAGSDDSGAAADGGALEGSSPHVFASLQYLRKLCSHPGLVMDMALPAHRSAAAAVLKTTEPAAVDSALRRLRHAPKLLALRDILATCGVIQPPGDGDEEAGGGGGAAGGAAGDGAGDASGSGDAAGTEGGAGAGHRLLVFAQHKALLDIVERDLLGPYGVSYLRLDGSVEAGARFGIVQRFNADPTIDVLLLTTGVGGVGLNLTAADTVVFLEHDWNPMKDMQAMDRAHRLGQRRTVSVYRILTRSTLEERVMGLQQFKMDVAAAVVNADNMSMDNMDTSCLLDVFGAPGSGAGGAGGAGGAAGAGGAGGAVPLPAEVEMAEAEAVAEAAGEGKGGKGKAKAAPKSGMAAALASVGDLWDESQYSSEFSMDAFMRKVGGGGGAAGGKGKGKG